MTVLFDTNVVLDVLMDRDPYVQDATALFNHVERGQIQGLITSTTVTTIYYVGRKAIGERPIRARIQDLLHVFATVPVHESALQSVLNIDFRDFEDAVLHEAARQAGADGIVTRNARDFTAATLSIYSPTELLEAVRNS
ncbi:PIN domain nuclease [Longimonas halophila]|uniref:PIN domain nuclease n=2 Tax=Longimonas halophila TaxID=1469170 RepID=A0A2H3NI93_9BACT|nr:PIN domain nuclease [Longimonas halophila]